MKKILTMCLAFAISFALFTISATADTPEINVILNGAGIEFDVPPQIIDNRTMVPMRAIFEVLGYEIEWDGETQMITATASNLWWHQLWLTIGSNIMVRYQTDGAGQEGNFPAVMIEIPIELDVPPQIVNNRTLVPLRAIAEATGAEVEWIEATRTVVITTIDEAEDDGRIRIHGAIHRIEYGDNVVYLFGSLHGGRPEWFPLASVVEDAMQRADVFAMEIDLSDEAALDEALESVMFLPDGLTWVEFLPDFAYEHLVKVLAEWDIPYEMVNTWNPYFLIDSLVMLFIEEMTETIDLDIESSVDVYVQNVALERGAPIFGLESVEQQINIVFNPPIEVMIESIMSFLPPGVLLEWLENDPVTVDVLAYYYETNNLAAINAIFAHDILMGTGSPTMEHLIEMISNYRSTYYANVIMRWLRETEEPTTLFVVVGLSHVIRSAAHERYTDIVEQLRLAGFEVVPIWE